MIYVLYGGDEVSRDEFLRDKLIARLRALPGGEFNLDRFDGRTAPVVDIVACCQTAPFLADKRMVVVEHVAARGRAGRTDQVADDPTARRGRRKTEDTGLHELWALLPDLPESTHLVLVDDRPPALPTVPAGRVYRQEFPSPRPWEVASWVARRARGRRLRLGPGVADTLTALCGSDLRRLDVELTKLSVYCGGETIREADVRSLVAPAEANVFALLDGVADRRPGAALAALRRLFQQGQPPEAIVPQLAALLRRLLIAHELLEEGRSLIADGAEFGLTANQRALEKLARQATAFHPEDFERAYELLLDCDRAIKAGRRAPELAVELLVAHLTAV
jgi:DNA polymerase III subunit delta